MTKLRFRLRPLVMIAAAVAAIAMIAGDADARVGGSRSSGSRGSNTYSAPPSTSTAPKAGAPMERTMTQPGQPGAGFNRSAAPAAQSGSWFNRPGMGMLGGLAAGFLGAGLLGMLMGHGFMGGLGGIASMLGLLFQAGLIALVVVMAWRWWQRRSQPAPAMAGGPQLRDMQPEQRQSFGLGSFGGGLAGGAAAAAPATRALSLEQGDFEAFEKLLGEIQAAWTNEDLAAFKSRATPEMVSYFAEDTVRQCEPRRRQPGDRREAAAGRPVGSLERRQFRVCDRRHALRADRQDGRSHHRPAGRRQRAAAGGDRAVDLRAHARRQVAALGDPTG